MKNVKHPWEKYTQDESQPTWLQNLDPYENTQFNVLFCETHNNSYTLTTIRINLTKYLDDANTALQDTIAQQVGYADFLQYVLQGQTETEAGIFRDKDGKIDKINSPGWVISLPDYAVDAARYLKANPTKSECDFTITQINDQQTLKQFVHNHLDITLDDFFSL